MMELSEVIITIFSGTGSVLVTWFLYVKFPSFRQPQSNQFEFRPPDNTASVYQPLAQDLVQTHEKILRKIESKSKVPFNTLAASISMKGKSLRYQKDVTGATLFELGKLRFNLETNSAFTLIYYEGNSKVIYEKDVTGAKTLIRG